MKAGDKPTGFFFADFRGDHVRILFGKPGEVNWVTLKPEEVGKYDNSLELPPGWYKASKHSLSSPMIDIDLTGGT